MVVRHGSLDSQPNLAEKIHFEFAQRVGELATSQDLDLVVIVLDTNRQVVEVNGLCAKLKAKLLGLGATAAFQELQIWLEGTSFSLISGHSLSEIFLNPVRYCVLANPVAFASIPSISDRSRLFFFTGPGELLRPNEKGTEHIQKIKGKAFNSFRFGVGRLSAVDAGPLVGLMTLVKRGKKLDGSQPWTRVVRLVSRTLYDYAFRSTDWKANDLSLLRVQELAATLFDVDLNVSPEDLVFVLREDLEPTVE